MKPYYQDEFTTIYCGDSRIILPTLADIDAIVTDPPYGIKRFEKGFGYTRFKGYGAEKNGLAWDKRPDQETIDFLMSVGKYHIVWGANNFMLPPSQVFLVWDKEQTVANFASCELAFCDIPSLTAKSFRYSIHKHNATDKYHPTQKPIPLMQWCLGFLPCDTFLICDPYMGSGSTLIAARNLGYKAIGIEIDEGYCEVAVKRLLTTPLPLRTPNNKIVAELLPSEQLELIAPEDDNNNQSPKAGP